MDQEYVGIRDVADLFGISKQTAYNWTAAANFPAPCDIVNRTTRVWCWPDVLAWATSLGRMPKVGGRGATIMIYAIRAGSSDHYKIGTSNNPVGRLRQLQTGHAEELQLVAATEGSVVEESRIHRNLDECRIRGEWFCLPFEPTAEHLGWLTIDQRRVRNVVPDEEVPVGRAEIAERLDVSRSAVTQWISRPTIGWPEFPAPRFTTNGQPAWWWPEVADWNRRARPDAPEVRSEIVEAVL